MKIFFLSLLFFSSSILLQAQNLESLDIEVLLNGDVLAAPFSGGFENPQFSAVDLNEDGLLDLYVFDTSGDVSSTFINSGNQYRYDPSFLEHFPDSLTNYVLLRDFDGDGAMDIFTHSGILGIDAMKVYKGYFFTGRLHFQAINFGTMFNGLPYIDLNGNSTLLNVTPLIYPVIDDLDNDGDLDIVSITGAGGYFKYYENRSVENGWGTDSLIYVLGSECFGGAFAGDVDLTVELADVSGTCATALLSESSERREELHGGFSMLAFDNDNDGDKELLFGDNFFRNMNLLVNGGDSETAFFTAQDTIFPNYNVPIDEFGLPSAFYFDANFDGEKDLVVSSRVNSLTDRAFISFYENMGTTNNPLFDFRQRDWLLEEVIDYGLIAHLTFTDFNQDGLRDLVVGTQSMQQNPNETAAGLLLFENTGTLSAPSFNLIDFDWLDLSSYDSYWLFPTFGDMDQDGDDDLLVADKFGKLIYLENTALPSMPASYSAPVYEYMGINADNSIGYTTSPRIVDMDKDGLNDLIIGTRQGNIVFFKNIGTTSAPSFNPDPMAAENVFQLGEVFLFANTGVSPFVIATNDGEQQLFVGNNEGTLWQYGNIDSSNLSAAFTLLASDWKAVDVGEVSSPAFVDLNNDGYLELFLGNLRGGINAYGTDIYVGSEILSLQAPPKNTAFVLFPNPTQHSVYIDIETPINKVVIYDILGRKVNKYKVLGKELDVNRLERGIYIVEIHSSEELFYGRLEKL